MGDRVIIQSGLQLGEKVIIKGNEVPIDGAAVRRGAAKAKGSIWRGSR